jgi:hypothetical protein
MSSKPMSDNNLIQAELYNISPTLAHISSETPYVAQDGYMEQAKLDLLKPIQTSDYSVPTGYFEQLPQQIMERIKFSVPRPSQKPPASIIRMTSVIVWTVAASVLLIAGIFSFISASKDDAVIESDAFAESNTIQAWEKEMDALNETEIIQYLQENGHDVEAALVNAYSESDPSESSLDLLLSDEWMKLLEFQPPSTL